MGQTDKLEEVICCECIVMMVMAMVMVMRVRLTNELGLTTYSPIWNVEEKKKKKKRDGWGERVSKNLLRYIVAGERETGKGSKVRR